MIPKRSLRLIWESENSRKWSFVSLYCVLIVVIYVYVCDCKWKLWFSSERNCNSSCKWSYCCILCVDHCGLVIFVYVCGCKWKLWFGFEMNCNSSQLFWLYMYLIVGEICGLVLKWIVIWSWSEICFWIWNWLAYAVSGAMILFMLWYELTSWLWYYICLLLGAFVRRKWYFIRVNWSLWSGERFVLSICYFRIY